MRRWIRRDRDIGKVDPFAIPMLDLAEQETLGFDCKTRVTIYRVCARTGRILGQLPRDQVLESLYSRIVCSTSTTTAKGKMGDHDGGGGRVWDGSRCNKRLLDSRMGAKGHGGAPTQHVARLGSNKKAQQRGIADRGPQGYTD